MKNVKERKPLPDPRAAVNVGKSRRKGVRTTRMMSFRLDADLVEWLDTCPNKGRLINQLLFNEKCRQDGGGSGDSPE